MSKLDDIEENTKEMNEAKLEQMIENYGNDILRLCTLYLKDIHLAEDALQDTFMKAWMKYDTYNGYSSEKTWITRIAINVCKNYLRTSWSQKTQITDVMEIVGADANEYRHLEDSIDLMNEILALKIKYQRVLLLYYYEEFSVKEIAEILHTKQTTIMSLLKRGREQLKKNWIFEDEKGASYEIKKRNE